MTRLFHSDYLENGQILELTPGQSHYLRHVLRFEIGNEVLVFNERDGEWLATVVSLSKSTSRVVIGHKVRPAVMGPDVSLLFAPLKHDPMYFLMEKATELGVRHFYPVTTERCNITRMNEQRLKSNIVDAAQQCERFDLPTLFPQTNLSKALAIWDEQIPLFICQERGENPSLSQFLRQLPSQAPVAFLVGPEGGFTSNEIVYLASFSFVKFVGLGPRILRAETAALAALTCYQALVGDWEPIIKPNS